MSLPSLNPLRMVKSKGLFFFFSVGICVLYCEETTKEKIVVLPQVRV